MNRLLLRLLAIYPNSGDTLDNIGSISSPVVCVWILRIAVDDYGHGSEGMDLCMCLHTNGGLSSLFVFDSKEQQDINLSLYDLDKGAFSTASLAMAMIAMLSTFSMFTASMVLTQKELDNCLKYLCETYNGRIDRVPRVVVTIKAVIQ